MAVAIAPCSGDARARRDLGRRHPLRPKQGQRLADHAVFVAGGERVEQRGDIGVDQHRHEYIPPTSRELTTEVTEVTEIAEGGGGSGIPLALQMGRRYGWVLGAGGLLAWRLFAAQLADAALDRRNVRVLL